MKRILYTIVCAVLLISFLPNPKAFASGERLATIEAISGEVFIYKANGKRALTAYKGMTLTSGDRISTGEGSVVLAFSNGAEVDDTISLVEHSTLLIYKLKQGNATITKTKLTKGRAFVDVASIKSENDLFYFEVEDNLLNIRGTNFFVGIDPNSGESVLALFSGIVQMIANQGSNDSSYIYPTQIAYMSDSNQTPSQMSNQTLSELLAAAPPNVLEATLETLEKISSENSALLNKLSNTTNPDEPNNEIIKANLQAFSLALLEAINNQYPMPAAQYERLREQLSKGSNSSTLIGGNAPPLNSNELTEAMQKRNEQLEAERIKKLEEEERKKKQEQLDKMRQLEEEKKKKQEELKRQQQLQAEQKFLASLNEEERVAYLKRKQELEEAKNPGDNNGDDGESGGTNPGDGDSGSGTPPDNGGSDPGGSNPGNGDNQGNNPSPGDGGGDQGGTNPGGGDDQANNPSPGDGGGDQGGSNPGDGNGGSNPGGDDGSNPDDDALWDGIELPFEIIVNENTALDVSYDPLVDRYKLVMPISLDEINQIALMPKLFEGELSVDKVIINNETGHAHEDGSYNIYMRPNVTEIIYRVSHAEYGKKKYVIGLESTREHEDWLTVTNPVAIKWANNEQIGHIHYDFYTLQTEEPESIVGAIYINTITTKGQYQISMEGLDGYEVTSADFSNVEIADGVFTFTFDTPTEEGTSEFLIELSHEDIGTIQVNVNVGLAPPLPFELLYGDANGQIENYKSRLFSSNNEQFNYIYTGNERFIIKPFYNVSIEKVYYNQMNEDTPEQINLTLEEGGFEFLLTPELIEQGRIDLTIELDDEEFYAISIVLK